MSLSHYRFGVGNKIPYTVTGAIVTTGKVFFVSSVASGRGDQAGGNQGQDPERPFATLDFAIGQCTANNGDVIFLMPNHAETISAASAITADVAGVTIIGLGNGAARPTFTFGTIVGASIVVSAANVSILNVVGVANIDGLTNPFHIQAADCHLDIEWQDGSATVEAARAILTTAAADRLRIKLRYIGFIAGDTVVNAIRLVGCDQGRIDVDFYGILTTAVVEFVTTACNDISVEGHTFVSGITNGSRNVVDTITGSRWYMDIIDHAAGSRYTGGSGAAVASDDISTIATNLTTLQAEISGAAGIVTFPAGAAAANAVSIAEVLRYVQENIVNGAGTVLPAGDSLYGILAGTSGITTFPAAAIPANGVSLAKVIRELYNQDEKAISTAAAVMANLDTTIFTIAGGPIEVVELLSVCVTPNDATASTLKYAADPTDGAVTDVSIASASLANAVAGTTLLCTGVFASAPTISANGVVAAGTTKFIVTAGIIKIVIATGPTTGTWTHHLRYKPLARGVVVS